MADDALSKRAQFVSTVGTAATLWNFEFDDVLGFLRVLVSRRQACMRQSRGEKGDAFS